MNQEKHYPLNGYSIECQVRDHEKCERLGAGDCICFCHGQGEDDEAAEIRNRPVADIISNALGPKLSCARCLGSGNLKSAVFKRTIWQWLRRQRPKLAIADLGKCPECKGTGRILPHKLSPTQ